MQLQAVANKHQEDQHAAAKLESKSSTPTAWKFTVFMFVYYVAFSCRYHRFVLGMILLIVWDVRAVGPLLK
jgi:hypothetical protein